MRTNVYIDGFNLYYGCLKGSPYRWLHLDALCTHLLPKHAVARVRYFTAKVSARLRRLRSTRRVDAARRAGNLVGAQVSTQRPT